MFNYVIDTNIVMSMLISGKSQIILSFFPGIIILGYNMGRSYGTAKWRHIIEP